MLRDSNWTFKIASEEHMKSYSHLPESSLRLASFYVDDNLSIRFYLRFYSSGVLSLPTSCPSTKSYRGPDRCNKFSTGRKCSSKVRS